MALYFLSFCSAYAFVFIKQANKSAWLKTYLVLLCLFLCFGYMTGSDWRSYEDIYDGSGAALLYYSNEPASAFLLHFAPY